jgi:hypothetical protein
MLPLSQPSAKSAGRTAAARKVGLDQALVRVLVVAMPKRWRISVPLF